VERDWSANISSLTLSCTKFNVDILCIVLLQVRVVRFSGHLSSSLSCRMMIMMSYVSIESASVSSLYRCAGCFLISFWKSFSAAKSIHTVTKLNENALYFF